MMINSVRPMWRARAVAVAAALGLAACATMQPPQTVEDRINAYWQHVVNGELAEAYRYMSPGYKQAMSEDAYIGRQRSRTVAWTAAEIDDSSECAEVQACSVRVKLTYKVSVGLAGLDKPLEMDRVVRQNWLKVDNAWYFVPDDL